MKKVKRPCSSLFMWLEKDLRSTTLRICSNLMVCSLIWCIFHASQVSWPFSFQFLLFTLSHLDICYCLIYTLFICFIHIYVLYIYILLYKLLLYLVLCMQISTFFSVLRSLVPASLNNTIVKKVLKINRIFQKKLWNYLKNLILVYLRKKQKEK